MKRILKSRVFLVIITILLTFGTTVGAVVLYEANQVSYTPQDSSWDVDTVEKALNDLYNNLGRGTATESQVLEGATFSSNLGKELLGTMKNNGAVTQTIAAGETYTIPEGYHNGEGTVTAKTQNSIELIGTLEWSAGNRSGANFTSKTITYEGSDKENLTIDNFILELVSASYCASPWGQQSAGYWNCPFVPTKTYVASTGILTVDPKTEARSGSTLVVNPTGLNLNVYVKH